MKSTDMKNEIWKDVIGFEGIYQISNMGNVRSLERITMLGKNQKKVGGYILRKTDRNRYDIVSLSIKSRVVKRYVHRLVAEAFIPNMENRKQVNHKDFNRKNNDVSNLEWVTRKENEQHKIADGRGNDGSRNGKSKLTESDVELIRHLVSVGHQRIDVADRFGITYSSVANIVNRKSWKHI